MAIDQTGAIYKALTFDGSPSRTFGVYITGEAVYNAPERAVEMISIPGRNGAYALDKGRFENIEVTYPAGIFADTETNFADAISDFRNFLCSKSGYVRLTDEYNPNEYRMAVYKSGLEVTPAMLQAGQFDITFECMPQRWLTSGESKVAVTSGDTITNPTLFDAKPMLEVEGYGEILINGESVEVQNVALGEIALSDSATASSVVLNTTNLDTGDPIYVKSSVLPRIDILVSAQSKHAMTIAVNGTSNGSAAITRHGSSKSTISIYPTLSGFVKGTDATATATAHVTITIGSTPQSPTITATTTYDSSTETVSVSIAWSTTPSTVGLSVTTYLPPFYGDSSLTILPTPLYIDLDIGQAYGESGGDIVSFNNTTILPAELPKLASGSNTITYDNTITDLKVVPRWWKV